MKTVDLHHHSFVEPTRCIQTVFDMKPFYFSEVNILSTHRFTCGTICSNVKGRQLFIQSYQLLLEFLHELNDAVLNVKTCDDVVVGDHAMKLLDMLDKIQVSSKQPNLRCCHESINALFRAGWTSILQRSL